MSAVRSAILTGGAHASKVLMGFILLKVMAVYLGPDGVGRLGHLMSIVSVLTILSGGGIIHALVKYCSEFQVAPRKLQVFVSAASTYAMVFSLVVFLAGCLLSDYLARLVFGSDDYQSVIVMLAVSQLAIAFANVVFGVSNGLHATQVFAYSQIIGNAMAVPLLWFCIYRYLEFGAAIAVVFASSLCALPAFYFYCRSIFWRRIRWFWIDRTSLRQLSGFTLMLLVSTLAFPLVEICVRSLLIQRLGYHDTGLWQASIRLSAAYMGFFTMFLAFYLVPRLSPERNGQKVVSMTLRHLLAVQVVYGVGALTLFLGRSFFIPIIFSDAFTPLEGVIAYQLIGDFFKVSAYVIGFIAVAKAATKVYICAEVFQGAVFLVGGWLAVRYGATIESVMQAYMLTYVLYFCVCLVGLWIYKRRHL